MKKKKTGFTLIELLVVIVLVISLLGIGIVSVTKITKKQKENAYEKVKDEVMLAGEQYFVTNEYLFDTLEEGSSGIITVKSLVEQDYLNKVTNPITGKALNMCDRVVVTRNDGKFDVKYEESSDTSCETSVVKHHIFEPGKPDLNITAAGLFHSQRYGNWYYSSVTITAKGNANGNGAIAKTGKCLDGEPCINVDWKTGDTYEDTDTYFNETDLKETYYITENIHGETKKYSVVIGVDKSKPNCTLNIDGHKGENNWYTSNVELSISNSNVSDNGPSGIQKFGVNQNNVNPGNYNKKSWEITASYDDGTPYYGHVIDNAGNKNTCEVSIKIDQEAPSCGSSSLTYKNVTSGKNSYCDPTKSLDPYHCTSVEVILNRNSDWKRYMWDGENSQFGSETHIKKTYNQAGTHNPNIKVYDEAGNFATCDADAFVIDKTKPNSISVENTPTVCQASPSNSANLPNILENFSTKSSSCDKKFQYVSGAFNGSLKQYTPINGSYGSFWLYLKFKSSDNTGGSGLINSTSSNYITNAGTGWEASYELRNKNNSEVKNCFYGSDPCSWKQIVYVYDRAGNYTSLSKYYNGIKY